jgi:CRISPR-associated protein Csx10
MTATKTIRYTLELTLPVLATDVEGEPNSAVSHSYIPGSLLRGALAALYLRNEGKGRDAFDAVADSEARSLFLTDETRFLHAYPVNESGQRGLPVPIPWRYNKEDHHTEEDRYWRVYDLSRCAPPAPFREQEIGHTFACWSGGVAELLSPARQINLHTQRDARKGRATGESSTIYRYDALAAGLRVQGLIQTAPELAPAIADLLPLQQTLWLGHARRAGYGEARVIEVQQLDYWRESDIGAPSGLETGGELRVTFTSDALLRNGCGQSSIDPLDAIANLLEVPQHSLTFLPDRSWAGSKNVGGFNRKWGLPLPQAVAISAGSVFTYRIGLAIDADKLFDLERDGIGERRNEGFGRLLVNWLHDQEPQFDSHRPDHKSPVKAAGKLSAHEEELARTIGRRLLRFQLDKELRGRANRTKLIHAPNKTQLARLRIVLRAIQAGREPGKADIPRLDRYLEKLRDTAGKQFDGASVDDGGDMQTLRDWLKANLQRPQNKWTVAPVQLGKGSDAILVSLDEDLAQEYGLCLIDQVLYRAAKEMEE